MPRSERKKWLNGQIELGAEAAADRGRNDAYRIGGDSEKLRDVGAIHIGRLRASLNLDLVADTSCETRLRFDVGVLDEAGFEFAFHDGVGLGQRFFYIAPHHASADQHVLRAMGMDERSARR